MVVSLTFKDFRRPAYFQVFEHIFVEIQREASRIQQERWWMIGLPPNEEAPAVDDNYSFELVSMLLSLSVSEVGQQFITSSAALVRTLLMLIATGCVLERSYCFVHFPLLVTFTAGRLAYSAKSSPFAAECYHECLLLPYRVCVTKPPRL